MTASEGPSHCTGIRPQARLELRLRSRGQSIEEKIASHGESWWMKCVTPQQRRYRRKTHQWRRRSSVGNPRVWQQRSEANQGARSDPCRGQKREERTEVMAADDRWGPEVLGRDDYILDIVLQMNPADRLNRSTAWSAAQVQRPTLPAAVR